MKERNFIILPASSNVNTCKEINLRIMVPVIKEINYLLLCIKVMHI